MLENAIRFSTVGPRTICSGDRRRRPMIVVVALLVAPGLANASPSSAAPDLEQAAIAHDEAGRHDEAARLFEQMALAADDADARMTAYLDAYGAWQAAFAATGARDHHCAARELLLRAQGDERLDPRARASFHEMAVALETEAIECSPAEGSRVALLDPEGELRAPRTGPRPEGIDAPRRSPATVGGAVSLALAAPAIGGAIYGLVRDAQVVAEAERIEGRVKEAQSVSDDDEARIKELYADAYLARGLAIGLGITGAALTGLGLALIVRGHRQGRGRTLAVLPIARADLGLLTLSGRF